MTLVRLLALGLCCAPLLAQKGDRPGEAQTPLPKDLVVPDAAPKSWADEQATLRVPAGFTVQLFAGEPFVADPVAAQVDAHGRLWVVEMRGYMNDLDATGENAPTGRIVVLHDDDGDGAAERSRVFADGLVQPRAALPLRGGALVVAPPELLWLPDADGDGVADGRTVVMGGFEAGLDNPEHSGNGLLWSFDHRIHLANDARMVRWTKAGFVVEPGAGGGQWGIAHDDRGRLFFNYNEDWLRCDLVPGRYGPLARAIGGLPQHNHRVVAGRTVWPARITPGVNRGYQPGRLVDHKLAIHTAVCSPHVYRGGLLPDCDGDVFVCEPAGNVVRRVRLRDHDGLLAGANVYEAERGEFLTSTDERFRPVCLTTGLDGALYVVDMYRGVIQHKNFVTSWLRTQIEQRQLAQPVGLGRIWRIAPIGEERTAAANEGSDRARAGHDVAARANVPPVRSLHDVAAEQLVEALQDGNGAVRDVALRELIQRDERSVVPALRQLAKEHARPTVRLAAWSAVDGLDGFVAADARAALRDADAGVVAFGLGRASAFLAAEDRMVWLAAEQHGLGPTPSVRWHVALALADVAHGKDAARSRSRRVDLLARMLAQHGGDAGLRAAVAAAARDDLADALRAAVAQPGEDKARSPWLSDLAARGTKARLAAGQQALFALAQELATPALRRAVLQGAVEALPKGEARIGWLRLPQAPSALVALVGVDDAPTAAAARELLAAIAVDGVVAPGEVAQLTVDEAQRVRAGEALFARACAACHQLDGGGMQGLAPALRDSEWATGPIDRIVRIVAHGMRGPVAVNGTTWTLEMPAQRQLSDADVAAIVGYVRRAFGHRQSVPDAAAVAAIRARHKDRVEPWTAEELLGAGR
ncbi:MAG: c-type cytochrome [Planctomycetes bacterium]|nr:c-type cytochrome [Planctomycetota bacterium]